MCGSKRHSTAGYIDIVSLVQRERPILDYAPAEGAFRNIQRMTKRRLSPKPENGITNVLAPFWLGDRSERVLSERLTEQKRIAEEKALNRRTRKRTDSTRPRRERGPLQQLRRLERNLTKRKTLAARQRLEQQIRLLKNELGL